MIPLYPPQARKAELEALGCVLAPPFFAPQASWPTYSGAATLPSSAFAGYDPLTSSNAVVGACVFDGSSQYASTSSPPTSELGNGTAYVVGARFYVDANTTARAIAALSAASATNPFAYFYVDANEGVLLNRSDGTTDSTTLLAAGQSGWVSVAVRYNADGTVKAAVLGPAARTVTWVSDSTVKTLTGLDTFSLGALLYNSTTIQYHDDAVCDVYFGSSATALEDAAMEAFCLGASPASAEVDAANHWPGQADWDDSIGAINLTGSGTPTFSGTSVCVNRDVTADSAHANYAANVKGGAKFAGTNYLSASWTEPSGDYYAAFFVSVPDATPAATVTLWENYGDTVNWRRVYLATDGTLYANDRDGGVDSNATIAAALTAGVDHLVVAKWSSTGAARSIWCAPVGGALSTGTDSTTRLPSTLGTLYLGRHGGATQAESGTVISKVRIFNASDVSDETAFLRALLRNWTTQLPTPVHQWDLDGDALDSAGSADLTWSASPSYSTSLVCSSHMHELPPTGVTYVGGELDYDGSTGYGRIANAFDVDTPFVVTARVEPDQATGDHEVWFGGDGTNNEYHTLLTSGTTVLARSTDGGATGDASVATAVSANTPATYQAEFASTTSRSLTVDGGSPGTNTATRDPQGIDRMSWGRNELATPGRYYNGTMGRKLLHADTSQNAGARTWVESAA